MTFLQQLADYLLKHHLNNLNRLCIVFPNRRAGLVFKSVLKEHIKNPEQQNSPEQLPEIYSIEDFIIKLSGLEILDPVGQLAELYNAYTETEKGTPESFDEFSKWGQILLSDFNEVDQYLIDPGELFLNLKSIREIHNWNLDETSLTEFQQNYLNFWESIGTCYTAFSKNLAAKRLAYPGMAYRKAAENSSETEATQSWEKIIFAGFNALNAAEEKLFADLVKQKKAEIFWDADSYYTENTIQEAGRFLRKYRNAGTFANPETGNFNWVENKLALDPKKITITGVSKNIGQARLTGQLIREQMIQQQSAPDSGSGSASGSNSGSGSLLSNTAIVLADETLLFPVLHSLPESAKNVNVSMGYPLKNTALAQFTDLILQLHENQSQSGKKKFYHRKLTAFFRHPYFSLAIDESGEKISRNVISYLQENNVIFCSAENIRPLMANAPKQKRNLLDMLFSDWISLEQILDFFSRLIENLEEQLSSSAEAEFLIAFSKIISRIKALPLSNTGANPVKTFRNLLDRMTAITALPFFGEPTSGLQIMGMLETRALDFDRVILLSANEGALPAGKTQATFIPVDLRRAFGLPTFSEKDALFAYHFYHLLQRAKHIEIIYNTEADVTGGGEKSRFLTQLLQEFPPVNSSAHIREQLLEVNTDPNANDPEIRIPKTEDAIALIVKKAESGFSPSLINIYRNCSLQFYFNLIGNLRAAETIQDSIGADTLGTVLHKTLEMLYRPAIDKTLTADKLSEMKAAANQLLSQNFQDHYEPEDLSFGKNLLTLKTAQTYLSRFFDSELEFIEGLSKQGKTLLIRELEKEYSCDLPTDKGKIKIKGKIDRIDEIGSTLRILDYKTGKTEERELKVSEMQALRNDPVLNKSFQLLMYALLVSENHQGFTALEPGVISFRQLTPGSRAIRVNQSKVVTKEVLTGFSALLADLFHEIYDPSTPFTQTADTKICVHCDFKSICNR